MATSNQTWQPPSGWENRPVCVLGAGVLGRRIAACFIAAGHHVRIRDPSEKSRNLALEYIKTNISAFTTLTGRKQGTFEATEDLTTAVQDCWLIFEAVPENLDLKIETFLELESQAPNDCILATNSSSYKSGELVVKLRDETKSRVLNTHFMMPPEAIIVELMTSGYTSEGIFPFLVERHKEAGLHPLVALKESTGFIFNRIWAAIKREVLSVLAEGVATPEMIDSMWIEQYAGRKVGPCTMMDQVGLDTVEHIEQHYIEDRHLPPQHLDWLKTHYIAQGKLGNKTDKGGLYPPKPPGVQTKLLMLNVGLAEPLKGKSPEEISNSGQILLLNASEPGARPTVVLDHLPAPDGIDVSRSTNRIYWSNMSNPKANDGSLQSATSAGTDVRSILPAGAVHTPKQLTIDQERDHIYFCDREGLRVMRCNLDGSELKTLYASGDWKTEPHKQADPRFWPVGIAISHRLQKFFWSQKGHSKANEGRIFCADLDLQDGISDPSHRTDVEIIADGLPEPIDLEFDDENGTLYWTDRGELPLGNTLNRKTIVGTPSAEEKTLGREVLAQGLGEGIGLRLDREARCVWVADMGGRIWRCSMDGGLKEKVFEGTTHSYTGLTFFRF